MLLLLRLGFEYQEFQGYRSMAWSTFHSVLIRGQFLFGFSVDLSVLARSELGSRKRLHSDEAFFLKKKNILSDGFRATSPLDNAISGVFIVFHLHDNILSQFS